jgi:hypothetical protein
MSSRKRVQIPGDNVRWVPLHVMKKLTKIRRQQTPENDVRASTPAGPPWQNAHNPVVAQLPLAHSNDLDFTNIEYSPYVRILKPYRCATCHAARHARAAFAY